MGAWFLLDCDTGYLNDYYATPPPFLVLGGKGKHQRNRKFYPLPLFHFHQIMKFEVNFFFKKRYYRGLNIYLELIFLMHNQFIDWLSYIDTPNP